MSAFPYRRLGVARHALAAVVGIAAIGCSASEDLVTPAAVTPPALAVVEESAAFFETFPARITHTSEPWGTATIRRGPTGIQAQLTVTDPVMRAELKGRAITIWVVSYHNPGACTGTPHCAESDVARPVTEAAVMRGGGMVVGQGPINLAVNMREGDTSTQLPIPGAAAGLIDAATDEIIVVIRSHGFPIPGLLDEQIHSINGGCPNGAPCPMVESLAVAVFKKI